VPDPATRWPKQRAELTDEQAAIFADWNESYLGNVLPNQFGWVDRFGHEYAARSARRGSVTLEIGAGNGSQLPFEPGLNAEYIALDHSDALASHIAERDPSARVVVGDCQEGMDFPDDYFDRVLAIHVLEHLDDLPVALAEISRVMKPTGTFSVIIPCEGGRGYALGRRLTTKRIFEKRYHTDYEWMIGYDHVNNAKEVLTELHRAFRVITERYFPLGVKAVDLNLVIGLELALP
jgi:SAM-dependent methyltransferase